MNQWLLVIGSILTAFIGIWKYFASKRKFQRKQAEEAKGKLDEAIKNDSPSDFLDGFGRM